MYFVYTCESKKGVAFLKAAPFLFSKNQLTQYQFINTSDRYLLNKSGLSKTLVLLRLVLQNYISYFFG